MKVHEFLTELNSHTIYEEPLLSKQFETETGHIAPWPKHTIGGTNATLGRFKGLVKEIKGNESLLCSYGHEIASACEDEFCRSHEWSKFYGRGSMFQAALKQLKNKNI